MDGHQLASIQRDLQYSYRSRPVLELDVFHGFAVYSAGSAGLCGAPEFTGPPQRGNGQVGLSMRGLTGKSFTIYGSTNLVNWAPLGTVPNPVGAVRFVDYAVTNLGQRFYRASQP